MVLNIDIFVRVSSYQLYGMDQSNCMSALVLDIDTID